MTEEVKELACLFAWVSSQLSKRFDSATPKEVTGAFKLFRKNKEDLTTAMWAEHCGVPYVFNGGYETVAALYKCTTCEALPKWIKEKLEQGIASQLNKAGKEGECLIRPLRQGAIYLATANGHGFTKIGFSARPKLRESTLQAEDPSFRIVFVSLPKFTIADEQGLHLRYSSKRRRGEWFQLSDEEISEIKNTLT